MTHLLTSEQWISRPLEEVFAFFSKASNLERITPAELRFSILNPEPIHIVKGAIIDYRLRLGGLPFNWKTEITAWNPPFEFEDTQLSGPYALWVHVHRFEFIDGRTRISDEVRFRLPLSPFSELIFPLIRFQLKRIFAYRHSAVAAYFSEEAPIPRISFSSI
jgi:ligand-binding SRPBCC domain-containing protein